MLGGDPEFASLSASRPPTAMESELVQQFGDLVGEALQTTLSTKDAESAAHYPEPTKSATAKTRNRSSPSTCR
jgi:flagellar motor switch protein FliM